MLAPAAGLRLPRTVFDTVAAPCLGDEAGAVASGSTKVLSVAQPGPGVGSVQLGPAAVVRVVALVRAPRKVGHAVRRDQEPDGRRARCLTPLGQPVLAVGKVHLAAQTVDHASIMTPNSP